MTVSLAELEIGHGGTVARVDGDDALGVRLMEMGVLPGAELRVVGAAPLGDPIELELRGYRLSVRRGEAERVFVDVSPA